MSESSPPTLHELAGRPQDARIALTCSGLSHVRRGVETWTQGAFEALRQAGVAVTLFKGSGANGLAGVRVLPCVRRGSRLSNTLVKAMPAFSWRLGFGSAYQTEQTTFALSLLAAGAGRFDLVHTKDPQVALLMHLANNAGLSRAKVILNHGTEEPPEFLQRFDYLQHLAPFHLEEALRQGVRAKRQFAIPNGVDTDTFSSGSGAALRQRLSIPQEAFVVLCVAAVKRHHKRIDWLLAEASRVRGAVYVLVVGAATDDTESVIRMGRERLGTRAVFLIDYPRDGMPEVYRTADVFVLCSLKEMLANASLEALASGVPCVMHREPVAQWAIGGGGETIDMTKPGELASTLSTLMQPDHRMPMRAQARAHALARFSKPVVLEQQLQMYREVLSPHLPVEAAT